MEKEQSPNRCATAVFGHKYMGVGDISAMGLIACAGWRDPTVFTAHKMRNDPTRVHVGHSSAMDFAVMSQFNVSNYGQEGYPANQQEADLIGFQEIGERCARMGLCKGCDRFVDGEPTIIVRKRPN